MSDNFNLDDLDVDLDFLEEQLKNMDIGDIDLDLNALDDKETRAKVMVVDDDAGTLRNIKSLLEGMYDVVLANSGRKALEIIAMENPDVILLDYEMPLMKGPETMRHIREKRGFENIPIIFLTGVNDRAQITAALALKPAGYLLKPVNKEKLFNTVLDVLNSADNNLIY